MSVKNKLSFKGWLELRRIVGAKINLVIEGRLDVAVKLGYSELRLKYQFFIFFYIKLFIQNLKHLVSL